jgi:hypothetical protein
MSLERLLVQTVLGRVGHTRNSWTKAVPDKHIPIYSNALGD